ncbi:hypothetical protein EVAR_36154_1 [Eumeta japonica]|uniref:Uncharacterized protein n=1 Tax=Eumeta variegata TaxID=151549 RepID=A0A4C1X3D6_EUMVA|nr:hypothetical protein EVAR_36154_1 [Eumeta japonica]
MLSREARGNVALKDNRCRARCRRPERPRLPPPASSAAPTPCDGLRRLRLSIGALVRATGGSSFRLNTRADRRTGVEEEQTGGQRRRAARDESSVRYRKRDEGGGAGAAPLADKAPYKSTEKYSAAIRARRPPIKRINQNVNKVRKVQSVSRARRPAAPTVDGGAFRRWRDEAADNRRSNYRAAGGGRRGGAGSAGADTSCVVVSRSTFSPLEQKTKRDEEGGLQPQPKRQATLSEIIDKKSLYVDDDVRAKDITLTIAEQICVDMEPFDLVNKIGFKD